jgi:hypothetical protein
MPTVSHNDSKIELKDAVVFRNEHDMIEVVAAPEAEMTVENMVPAMNAAEKLAKGKKACILFITHPTGTMTAEARKLPVTEQKIRYTLAQAIVVSSTATLLMANFYVRMKRFPFPYRVFKSRDKAIAWLSDQRVNEGSV